jgi:hypothetical protein
MPLPMIHLSVALNIEKRLNLKNNPLFFLGSISPDAIHMRTGTVREDKGRTHHIGETRDKTLENVRNILELTKKMEDRELREFIFGYCTHILTDVLWTDTVWRDYIDKVADLYPKTEHRPLYYKETDYMDFKIFREAHWRERIWRELSACKSPDYFGILTSEEIEKWKVRTLTWFEDDKKDPKVPPLFIKEDIVEKFISEAADFVNSEIASYAQ